MNRIAGGPLRTCKLQVIVNGARAKRGGRTLAQCSRSFEPPEGPRTPTAGFNNSASRTPQGLKRTHLATKTKDELIERPRYSKTIVENFSTRPLPLPKPPIPSGTESLHCLVWWHCKQAPTCAG